MLKIHPTRACVEAANTDDKRSNATFWLAVILNFVTLGEMEKAAVAEAKFQAELCVFHRNMYYVTTEP